MAIDNYFYREASFRGTSFRYISGSTISGRKTVTHDYPNSKIRVVEDLGERPDTYNIEAYIDTNKGASKRDAFIKQLRKKGTGTLVHPLYGNKKGTIQSWVVNDTISELGASRISFVFEESSDPVLPFGFIGNAQRISQLRSQVLEAQQGVGEALFAIAKSKAAYSAATNKINSISSTLKATSSGVVGAADIIADFSTAILVLDQEIDRLLASPGVMFARIANAIDLLDQTAADRADAFDINKSFSNFNSGDETTVGTSTSIEQRQDNQDVLNQQMTVSSLANNYNNSANIGYSTLDQLNGVRQNLEENYEIQINIVAPAVAELLKELRIEANAFLDNLSVNLASISEIEIPPMSLNVLTYSLYGSLDNKDTLRQLNNFTETSRISGTVKVLTTG